MKKKNSVEQNMKAFIGSTASLREMLEVLQREKKNCIGQDFDFSKEGASVCERIEKRKISSKAQK